MDPINPEPQLRAPTAPESNFPLAIGAGLVASVVGGVVWAMVTIATDMQIGFMAIGVGFLVGIAVGRFNPAGRPALGCVGAGLALLGCLLGNVFTILGYVSNHEEISIFRVLGAVDLTKLPAVMIETFSPMDIVFYAIAIYEGYKFSMKAAAKAAPAAPA